MQKQTIYGDAPNWLGHALVLATIALAWAVLPAAIGAVL